MLTRRALLKNSALLSLAPVVPGFLSRTALAASPSAMPACWSCSSSTAATTASTPSSRLATRRTRSTAASCGCPTDKLCKIGDGIGLHPAMRPAADLLRERPAGDRPGGRLSEPQPFAFREHGDLADCEPGPSGRRRPRLAGPGPRRRGQCQRTGRGPRRRPEPAPRPVRAPGRHDVVCRCLRPVAGSSAPPAVADSRTGCHAGAMT